MSNKTKNVPRRARRRPRPPTAGEIFDRIERADSAMKKLFLDEALTDEELDALLNSEYLETKQWDQANAQPETLYNPSKLGIAVASPILFSNYELEVLAYFGRHPETMYSLTPRKFEELVATVLRNNGFEVELTPETRDGGIDIIAARKSGIGGETLHFVECKRYARTNKVGIGIVQRMMGVVEQHRATQGIIVTTSSFTRDAQVTAQHSPHRLGLNSYTELAKWLAAFSK